MKGERMTKSYLFTIPALVAIAVMVIFGSVIAAGEQSLADLIEQEETGIEISADLENSPVLKAPGNGLITNTIPQDSVLMVPNSEVPTVIFIYPIRSARAGCTYMTPPVRFFTLIVIRLMDCTM
jgi:hypothetical protein